MANNEWNKIILYSCILVGASGLFLGGNNLCKPLKAPSHGSIACGEIFPFYTCFARCDTGYTFRNGLSEDKRECDQMFGEWFDPPGKNISDCIENSSPLCYSCQDSPTDGACKNLTECSNGEVCSLYRDSDGYTHTCMDENVCKTGQSMTKTDCWICCADNLCNKQCNHTDRCQDTPNCNLLNSTGYNVCHDSSFASSECKKTCGFCSSG